MVPEPGLSPPCLESSLELVMTNDLDGDIEEQSGEALFMSSAHRRPELRRDATFLLGAEGISAALGIVSQLILTHMLLQIEYGMWVIIYDLFATLFLILDFGIPTLLAREGASSPGAVRGMVWQGIKGQLAIAVVIVPLGFAFSLYLWGGSAGWTSTLIALGWGTILLYLSSTHKVALRTLGEARSEAAFRALDRITITSWYVMLYLRGSTDVLDYAIGFAASMTITTTVMVIWANRVMQSRTDSTSVGKIESSSSMLRRSLPFAVTLAIFPLMARTDKFLIAIFHDYERVAIYNIAWIVLMAGFAVPTTLGQAILPILGEVRENAISLAEKIDDAMRLTGWLTPIGVIAGVSIAAIAVPAMFPAEYVSYRPEEGVDAVALFILMLPAWIWAMLGAPVFEASKVLSNTWLHTILLAMGLATNVVIGLLLIPTWSLRGAALSMIAGHVVIMIIAGWFTGTIRNIPWTFFKHIAAGITMSAGCFWVAIGWNPTPFSTLPILAICVVVAAVLLDWKPIPPVSKLKIEFESPIESE